MDEQEAEAALAALALQERTVRDLAWACFSPPLLHIEHWGNSTACTGATNGNGRYIWNLR